MKIRQIIVIVQSFGHFDRINCLKLFPEVNLRDISNYYGQIIMNYYVR